MYYNWVLVAFCLTLSAWKRQKCDTYLEHITSLKMCYHWNSLCKQGLGRVVHCYEIAESLEQDTCSKAVTPLKHLKVPCFWLQNINRTNRSLAALKRLHMGLYKKSATVCRVFCNEWKLPWSFSTRIQIAFQIVWTWTSYNSTIPWKWIKDLLTSSLQFLLS